MMECFFCDVEMIEIGGMKNVGKNYCASVDCVIFKLFIFVDF